jgi:predicted lipoprotein with Yx(FWY)xxD motif
MLRVTVAGLAAVLALAACGGDDDDDGGAVADVTTTVATDETEPADDTEGDTTTTLASEDPTDDAPATLAIGETALGATIVDADGLTLYVFDNDSDGTSACVDACATAWPPVTVEGEPVVADNVDAANVGTITRADGTAQVTFYGMPLYTFSGDANPGDTNGLGVNDVWWPVDPQGEKLTGTESASSGGSVDEY